MQHSGFMNTIIMSNSIATVPNKSPNEPSASCSPHDDGNNSSSTMMSRVGENEHNSSPHSPVMSGCSSDSRGECDKKSPLLQSTSTRMKPKRRRSLPMKKRKSLVLLDDEGGDDAPSPSSPPLLSLSENDTTEEPAKKKQATQHGFNTAASEAATALSSLTAAAALAETAPTMPTSMSGSSPLSSSSVSEEDEACILSLAALAAAKNRSFKAQAHAAQQQKEQQLNNGQEEKEEEATACEEAAPKEQDDSQLTPQINDVLTSCPPQSTFHHIGNRRFRVLVEANLGKYFEEFETEEQWQDLLQQLESGEMSEGNKQFVPSERQCQVVEAVIESVRGNVPPGRFLFEQPQQEEEKKNDSESGEEGPVTVWKLATEEEIRSKVHSTFLAAGRFHVKQQMNAAAMMEAQAAALERLHQQKVTAECSEEAAPEEGGEQEDQEEGEEETSENESMEVEESTPSPTPPTTLSSDTCTAMNLAALAEAQRAHVESIKNRNRRTAALEEAMARVMRERASALLGNVPIGNDPTEKKKKSSPKKSKKKSDEQVKAIEESLQSLRAQQAAEAEDKAKMEAAAAMAAGMQQPKIDEQVGAMEEALLSLRADAKAKLEEAVEMQQKHEQEGKEASKETASADSKENNDQSSKKDAPSKLAHLEEALRATATAATSQNSVAVRRPSAVASSNNKSEEVEYLMKESMRINAILSQGKTAAPGLSNLSNIVPSYLPLRSRKAAGEGAASLVSPMEGANHETATAPSAGNAPSGLPSSIDELFKKASSSAANANSRKQASSIEELYAYASSAATSTPSSSQTSSREGSVSPKQGEVVLMENALTAATPAALVCPARIKVFLALPMDRFFVEDVDPIVTTSEYIMPSNYDILCGPDWQSFFHHVGNRRFRIMIEMNARRYEKAYLASLSGNASRASTTNGDDAMESEEEDSSIDKLIEEMVSSLSKCDPHGRFLGMEMTTGRWRVLNPVYAQLKTEQTFFECLQVEQKRQRAAAAEAVRMEEEERATEAALLFRNAVEREKELLLEELEGRMMGAGLLNPEQQQRQLSRRISQVSLGSESCPTGMCPSAYALRNPLPALNGAGNASTDDDLSLLQSRAKELLRRRQAAIGNGAYSLVETNSQQSSSNSSGLSNVAMSEIVQRFAQEQQQLQSQLDQDEASRALLLNKLQQVTAALPSQKVMAQRRNSLPATMLTQPLTSLRASFSVGQHDTGGVFGSNGSNPIFSPLSSSLSSSSRMAKRPSNFSCDSHDSIQQPSETEAAVAAAAAAMGADRQLQRHQEETSPSPALSSSNNNDSGNTGVKDLLDVVGGMMMMSRRGSC